MNLDDVTQRVEDQSGMAERRSPASIDKPTSHRAFLPTPLQPRELVVVDAAGRQCPVAAKRVSAALSRPVILAPEQ